MPYFQMDNNLLYSLKASSSIIEAYFSWVNDWVFSVSMWKIDWEALSPNCKFFQK